MNNTSSTFLHWLIVLLMPFMLASAVITFIIDPWFPSYEYAKPDFPLDQLGWTQDEQLELALVAVDYLARNGSAENTIYLLEEQTLPGSTDPLYNEREIDHMVDVKRLTNAIRWSGWGMGVVVVISFIFLLYRNATEHVAYRAMRNGGLFTILILLAIGGFILTAWDTFFIMFHELLFPPGSWTFLYTDSLIRLFPEKLWIDVGITIVGGTLFCGFLMLVLGWLLSRRI